jgi:hypothetical protein
VHIGLLLVAAVILLAWPVVYGFRSARFDAQMRPILGRWLKTWREPRR